ncbi:MAG: TolC family protein, partial [Thermanaerothrix sp.]|nr:TolC family protein [Thermanaerothrix sp.]
TSTWVDQGSLSIALNWSVDSLLPFSSAGESRDTLMDTIRDLQYQIEDARKNAELTRNSYIREIEQYLTALESYQANERLAQRSLELTQLAYNNGLADFISVQNAADDLAEVRYSILEYTYNLSITLLNLEYSLGLPFGTLGR